MDSSISHIGQKTSQGSPQIFQTQIYLTGRQSVVVRVLGNCPIRSRERDKSVIRIVVLSIEFISNLEKYIHPMNSPNLSASERGQLKNSHITGMIWSLRPPIYDKCLDRLLDSQIGLPGNGHKINRESSRGRQFFRTEPKRSP